MRIDPSKFHQVNSTDTCSVWNVLSSQCLYSAAVANNVVFCCTRYVMYECIVKPRKQETPEQRELLDRLRQAKKRDQFGVFDVLIEDLQNPQILALRERLGHGELSAIAFALQTGQAVLTDDQEARRSAEQLAAIDRAQTTPKLFGWLMYRGHLSDADKDVVIQQHEEMEKRQPLTRFFEEMYRWALDCRLRSKQ